MNLNEELMRTRCQEIEESLERLERRRNEGVPSKKAVIGTAHKLIRVIFSMLSHKTYFSCKYPSIIVYQGVNS
jgi:hypothetical protein